LQSLAAALQYKANMMNKKQELVQVEALLDEARAKLFSVQQTAELSNAAANDLRDIKHALTSISSRVNALQAQIG
jgi:hypothetical protein